MFTRILLDSSAGDGNGSDPEKERPKGDDQPKAPTLDEMRRKIEERGVDSAAKLLLSLQEDNYKYRSRLRDLEAKLPPDGSVVLQGDDAKAWESYRGFGKPSEIRVALEERQSLATWKRDREQQDTVHEVAKLHGWKSSLLGRFVKAEALEVVIDEDQGQKDKDGKPVRKGFVVTRGDDGSESKTGLDEYAETHWKDDLEALLREPSDRPKALDRPDPMRPKADDKDHPINRELSPSRML